MSHRVQQILSQLAPVPTAAAAAVVAAPPQPVIATADLCDDHAAAVSYLPFQLKNYGQLKSCHGPVVTLKVYEDNGLVRSTLEQAGAGRVILVDGGGSMRCALVGDQLGTLILKNGWAGVIVIGCVRDAAAMATMPICVQALGTNPVKSVRRGGGQANVPLVLGGTLGVINTGDYIYADEDGVLVAKSKLHK